MAYEQGTNDVYVAGKLISEEEVQEIDPTGRYSPVWINNNNKLQFWIKPISPLPVTYPEIKYFDAYANYLKDLGFDEFIYDYSEREKKFLEYISKYIIVFKPFRKDRHNTIDQMSVMVVDRPEGFNDNTTYTSIPVFRKNENLFSQKKFEQLLQQGKFLGTNANISKDIDDTPEFVLWYDDENFQYTAYGIIDEMAYDKVSGLCFAHNTPVRSINFSEEWQQRSIMSSDLESVLFVDSETYKKVRDEIDEFGQVVSLEEHRTVEKSTIVVKSTEKADIEVIDNGKETEFLDRFIEYTENKSFVYEKNDLVNFHVAMKSSNLVILAGMSGTGKSKLVRLYGESMGLSEEQIKVIPVRPSWTDDADLLGYLDTMNMVYRPSETGLVDTLMKAEIKDNIYIICFDEMNLSRVEHYFSQFLSILEDQNEKRYLQLYNDELKSRVYNSNQYPPKIELGNNILFVGTVNIDESTYHFSDKTLDRANVINLHVSPMQKLKELSDRNKANKPDKLDKKVISFRDYDSFVVNDDYVELNNREIDFLNELHNLLHKENANMGIGFRIVKQIDKYLKNIPQNQCLDRKVGFDLQVLQRIMTKIRGTEEQLENIFGKYNKKNNELKESKLLILIENYADVSEFYETKLMILNKAKELKLHGYTI